MEKYQKIKSHKFRLGNYKLEWSEPDMENTLGLCTSPSAKPKTIQISPNLENDEKLLLQVLLDESIHASIWEIDNDVVEEMAITISDFLWRSGYRRTNR